MCVCKYTRWNIHVLNKHVYFFQLLSVLLRTEKVYDRNKTRLRLNDSTQVGMYPGLIAMLPDQQLSMEFTTVFLDQILLTGETV